MLVDTNLVQPIENVEAFLRAAYIGSSVMELRAFERDISLVRSRLGSAGPWPAKLKAASERLAKLRRKAELEDTDFILQAWAHRHAA